MLLISFRSRISNGPRTLDSGGSVDDIGLQGFLHPFRYFPPRAGESQARRRTAAFQRLVMSARNGAQRGRWSDHPQYTCAPHTGISERKLRERRGKLGLEGGSVSAPEGLGLPRSVRPHRTGYGSGEGLLVRPANSVSDPLSAYRLQGRRSRGPGRDFLRAPFSWRLG